MRRIFFGGTFDPIHVGHTRLALECQRLLAAPVTFVPAGIPPHKGQLQILPTQRLAMVQLAVDELNCAVANNEFAVDRMEIDADTPSFTVNTLNALRERHRKDDLFWLIGMDSLVNLASWHEWHKLTDFANLLVVNRPGWQLPRTGLVADWLADKCVTFDAALASGEVPFINGKVVLLQTTAVDIASSAIKQQLQFNDCGKFLLPESVREYIIAQRLYH